MSGDACRLCGGTTVERFRLEVLGKHDVGYRECQSCRSLQTEKPFWLDEAYARSNLATADTGAAQRTVRNAHAVLIMRRFLKFERALDFGGGDGLFCRLLRDRGIDAYCFDKYTEPKYAQTFAAKLSKGYDLITAFEVLEHLPEPQPSLEDFFSAAPRFLLASTELYSGQEKDWWYLSPHTGQHIFFYSHQALRSAASKHGYFFYSLPSHHLFSSVQLSRLKLFVMWRMLARWFPLARSALFFSETWDWAVQDYNRIAASQPPR